MMAALFLFAALIMENRLLKKLPDKIISERFQDEIIRSERNLLIYMSKIETVVDSVKLESEIPVSLNGFNLISEKNEYSFLVYKGQSLLYWSDRSVSFGNLFDNTDFEGKKLIHLRNGYYLKRESNIGSFTIIGLILIKNDYPYENDYLKNDFFRKFKIPPDYILTIDKKEKGIPVYNSGNEFLFTVIPSGNYFSISSQLWIPWILYLLGLIILLSYFRIETVESESSLSVRFIGLIVRLFLLYWIHLLFKIPKIFYQTEIFSPDNFAFSYWLPSLGDYLILSVFFFFMVLNFYYDFNVKYISNKPDFPVKLLLILILFGTGIVFMLTDYLIKILITNSNISFSLNQINTITSKSIIGLISIAFLLLSGYLIIIRVIEESKKYFRRLELFIYSVCLTILLAALQLIAGMDTGFPVLLLFLFMIGLSIIFSHDYLQNNTLSYLIIFISVITIYSISVIYSFTVKRDREIQKTLAVILVSEHDPAAEVFLTEIQQQINVDSALPQYLFSSLVTLEDYISRTYFEGFFRKYDLQISVCDGADSLLVRPENIKVPCFPFFDNMIESKGQPIPGTNFYYINNMDGRITYFGRLHYPLSSDSIGISIFLELSSKLQSEGIGYPELLIDKKLQKPTIYRKFNYAKYFGGELVDKYGDYQYNYYIYSYEPGDEEFELRKWDGFEHLIYRTPEDNNVIVSREMFSFVDYLISFPYLFVFFFIIFLIFILLNDPVIRKRSFVIDLKFKIQAAIISIVFVSLLIVALGTLLYNVNDYRAKLRNDLNEKMKSITEEIDMRLQDIDSFNPEIREWLRRELAKLSNIFRTDINIFGNDGDLVASSRPEIFSRGLVSTKMNPEAFFQLSQNFLVNYIQPEKIGSLSYLSAYEPILNEKGAYLGFINLPYFIRQDKYNQEISTLIVAFINLYLLLLLLSIVIAVVISNQITKPLAVIRDNLRKMELGKRSEPIDYRSRDEIGDLIKEYNKKVDELAFSAELLARSERESAWREMAKQVAHEIKNPLTPMKLNIQHLQRAKAGGKEYHEFIERVTKALIEQIDTLSEIATEFSSFAQIPTARNQVFNLAEQLKKVISLYESHDRIIIQFNENNCGKIMVNADREQLSRAIINLIKNGIQSIPEEKEGKIIIALSRKDHIAVISVRDNGIGIPEDMRDKLFSPSFTTKSSGMGLGLAIVKNIVENFRGRVWFQTEIDSGSVFYIEIPVFEGNSEDEF